MNDVTEVDKPVYLVGDYGFINSKYTDQMGKLQVMINNVSSNGGGIIDLQGLTIAISSKLYTKSNIEITNGTIKFIGLAQVVVKYENVILRKLMIDSSGYGHGSLGVIEFVEAVDPLLDTVYITGNHLYKGILCKTSCTGSRIIDTKVFGLGWGILFNDSIIEQGENWRLFDGENYTCPIGDNHVVDNFEFTPGAGRYGDGIEFNVPDHGMNNVEITNSVIHGANATYSNGIGIGAANVNNLVYDNCKVYNAKFDAFHIEKGDTHSITHCYAYNCGRALGLSHNVRTVIDNNKFELCGTWLSAYNRLSQYQQMSDVSISNNVWNGTTGDVNISAVSYGCLFSNAVRLSITNNIFKGYMGSANTAIIQFYNAGVDGVYDSEVLDNLFYPESSTVMPNSIISLLHGSSNNNIKGNIFQSGYMSSMISGNKQMNLVSDNTDLIS